MHGLTYSELVSFNPCDEAFHDVVGALGGKAEWGDTVVTVSMARQAGVSFEKVLWAVTGKALRDEPTERLLRLFAADCAAHVLHIYEKAHPGDLRVRDCIQAARDFANGKIDQEQLREARSSAKLAALSAKLAAWSALSAARSAAWSVSAAAMAGERKWQYDRLEAWFGDDEPEPIPFPEISKSEAA